MSLNCPIILLKTSLDTSAVWTLYLPLLMKSTDPNSMPKHQGSSSKSSSSRGCPSPSACLTQVLVAELVARVSSDNTLLVRRGWVALGLVVGMSESLQSLEMAALPAGLATVLIGWFVHKDSCQGGAECGLNASPCSTRSPAKFPANVNLPDSRIRNWNSQQWSEIPEIMLLHMCC